MLKIQIILLVAVLLFSLPVRSQCPDRDYLWKRILFLRDSSKATTDEKLQEMLQFAAAMQSCTYRGDSTHAYLLQRIAVMYYKKSDYAKAIAYTRESISLITANYDKPFIDRSRLKVCYNNLVICYDSLRMEANMNRAVDSCVLISIRNNFVDAFTLSAIRKKTEHLFNSGDYAGCLTEARIGQDLVRHYFHSKDSIDYIMTLGEWEAKALVFMKHDIEAETLLLGKIAEYEKAGFKKDFGPEYGILAIIYDSRGEIDRALAYYRLALKYYNEYGRLDGCASMLDGIGFLYFGKAHRYDLALACYRRALGYSIPAESINIMDNVADLYIHLRRYDSGFYYFQKGFDLISPGMDETGLLHNPARYVNVNLSEYVIGLLLDKADACLQLYKEERSTVQIQRAIGIYKTTDQLLDSVRDQQYEIRSRLFWRSHTRRLYEHAIEACYLSGNVADAFYFFEKSRAALLGDQLVEQRRSDDEEILELAQLKTKSLNFESILDTISYTSPKHADIQNELIATRQRLEILELSIRNRNPIYYQSILDTGFITIPVARSRLLSNHRSLVELFTGDSAVWCLIITSENIHLTRIDKSEFDNTTTLFESYVSDRNRTNAHFRDFTNTASRLYTLLFGKDSLPAGNIIVSQDSRWFSFEALVSRLTPSGPRYLVYDHAITYTYSARYLLYGYKNHPASNTENFLGVAPINYAGSLRLPALTGSERSLQHIASNFSHADFILSSHATRNNFLREFYRYPIIQLYTHAADNSSDRNEPVIYFADSALYLSDLIPESKPATQLIVLSACETGSGQLYQGEGVFSFNRGFAALGIPSSITNLWAVDDQSTYRLTELFYRHLSEGLPADQALQQAKLDFIGDGSGEKSLPYYWAAPVFAGDGSFTITRSTAWSSWPSIIGLLLIALFATVILYWHRHRTKILDRRLHRRYGMPPTN